MKNISPVRTPALGRYTVLAHDGLSAGNPYPEAPASSNTASTLAGAEQLFRRWLRESGNHYTRAEGYGSPWADVVPTENWDGTSYGDITGGEGVLRFERGVRGGITRNNF